MKKLLLIILGILCIALGIYGLIVWWWPLFVKIFLGCLGPVLFLAGLILIFIGKEE
ncbi:MAG: hypothetical protein WC320_00560 [Candidatus Paceibacterota bacterium]|jgi:hypothetical protein